MIRLTTILCSILLLAACSLFSQERDDTKEVPVAKSLEKPPNLLGKDMPGTPGYEGNDD